MSVLCVFIFFNSNIFGSFYFRINLGGEIIIFVLPSIISIRCLKYGRSDFIKDIIFPSVVGIGSGNCVFTATW